MIRRLRIKFVCIIMLIVTIMLAVIFGMVLRFTWEGLESRSIQLLQNIPVDMPQHERQATRFESIRIPYILAEVNPQGNLISFRSFLVEELEESFIQEIVKAAVASEERTGVLESQQLRFLKTGAPFGSRIVFGDISSEREIISDLIRNCILIYAVSFIAFLGISILLSGWVIRPVETAWNQQRQFVADASHELKTPLTVILTNAELLQNDVYSPEENRKFISSILAMSHQMRGLVEGLLDLARVDNGAVKMVFSDLDFGDLISEELLPFEPLFFERDLEISAQIEPDIRVRGSESHLRQLLNILLDNASKYSLTPGLIRVELKKQGSHCLLSVSNPSEDISRKELKNIFRRFYRMDKVRSMSHSYGLGLAIAEALVREHRGRIWAESREGRVTFFVLLPMLYSVSMQKR